jgi:hypothetical protein
MIAVTDAGPLNTATATRMPLIHVRHLRADRERSTS